MDRRVTTLVGAGVLTLATLAAPAAQAPPEGELHRIAWLAGCWTSGAGGRQVDEQWMKPLGGTMMGMSRTVVGGKTVDSEVLLIRATGSDVAYVARPAGQPEASFKLVSATANEARFENPEHDFPQRIIYRLNPDGSLHARIEGTRDGKVRGVDFPMTRGTC
jgi:Domain of unknown function (DUF6265)